ncbi:DedA family protein [Domibacillus robiginosus]|uniref:DedA family protein n=1 Tax=Domibacillus robiginosus TaxID=1071054 RepID=UPI00067E2825|nr:DedA family protein [Domibacillus robiginosus]
MESLVITYLAKYGYAILFAAGIFGIVGIPVPEESLYVYVGMLAKNGSISFPRAFASLLAGTLVGMAISYTLGRIVGQPLLDRYGKYLGVTKKRLRKTIMHWDLSRSLLAGFFIPGVRQFNPYFAGIARFSIPGFLALSVLGGSVWVLLYMSAGFLISSYIQIKPEYLAIAGAVFFVLFVVHFIMKWKKSSHSRR